MSLLQPDPDNVGESDKVNGAGGIGRLEFSQKVIVFPCFSLGNGLLMAF